MAVDLISESQIAFFPEVLLEDEECVFRIVWQIVKKIRTKSSHFYPNLSALADKIYN